MSIKVYLDTLGCRLNESEIENIGRAFLRLDHEVVKDVKDADLCVVNTCAVTNEAGKKSRQLIRWMNRNAPGAQIVVTGCYSEIEKEKTEALPGVSNIVSNLRKEYLVPDLLGISEDDWRDQEPLAREALPGDLGRTRAFLKVQDGCDNRCTFCVTTIARGPGRSIPLDEILNEVRELHRVGYKEIVLSGVHLGAYGKDIEGEMDLKILVQRILDETTIPRVRLSSLEPWDIPEGFWELWQDPRMCRHIHLPLQAGCDRTLKRMARRTRVDKFRRLMEEARAHIPGVAISSDIIVGFPGETEEDFAESLAYTKEMGFSHIHVFRYSMRPGTAAASMPDQIPNSIKAERSAAMQEIARAGQQAFQEDILGEDFDILWEQTTGEDERGQWWQGLTDTYIRVKTFAPRDLKGRILPVRLKKIGEDGLIEAALL